MIPMIFVTSLQRTDIKDAISMGDIIIINKADGCLLTDWH